MQVLQSHAASAIQQQRRDVERNDPATVLSLYAQPPAAEQSILDLEDIALARLRVLKGIELLKSQGKAEAALRGGIDKLLETHVKADAGAPATRERDAVGHFMLRLAFCASEDDRRWLLAGELDLFRHRFAALQPPERAHFLAASGLPYEAASDDELRPLRPMLQQAALHTASASGRGAAAAEAAAEVFRVPFEQVPDLVAQRKVLLHRGAAYVPVDLLGSVVAVSFRAALSRALVLTAGRWATTIAAAESQRLAPVLRSLSARHVGLDGEGAAQAAAGGTISLEQVPALAQRHFPLCMHQLYGALQSDHHLRHAGRMQLGLFLKRAGLTLEESMAFWKRSFAPRTAGDKFEKEYAYNVRHSYGREGRRKDYEAQSCLKVIATNPGVGEAHGCPFKSLPAPALAASLSRLGVPPMLAKEAQQKARDGHFQVACARVFEGRCGEAPDAGVTHPNGYLAESLAVAERRAEEQQVRASPAGAATPAGGAGGAPDAAPSTSGTTPGLPFRHTPMHPLPAAQASTPSASGLSAPSTGGGGVTPATLGGPAGSPIAGVQVSGGVRGGQEARP